MDVRQQHGVGDGDEQVLVTTGLWTGGRQSRELAVDPGHERLPGPADGLGLHVLQQPVRGLALDPHPEHVDGRVRRKAQPGRTQFEVAARERAAEGPLEVARPVPAVRVLVDDVAGVRLGQHVTVPVGELPDPPQAERQQVRGQPDVCRLLDEGVPNDPHGHPERRHDLVRAEVGDDVDDGGGELVVLRCVRGVAVRHAQHGAANVAHRRVPQVELAQLGVLRVCLQCGDLPVDEAVRPGLQRPADLLDPGADS
ncbi:hypothetical protein BJF78_23820 [Pseudonocardia sp. CNS-139]|nr:hypothetical protein BJF78_23820 [Pseudonocardia sp. CNS-139]